MLLTILLCQKRERSFCRVEFSPLLGVLQRYELASMENTSYVPIQVRSVDESSNPFYQFLFCILNEEHFLHKIEQTTPSE